MNTKKLLKWTVIILGAIILILVAYVIYLNVQYYRIEDNIAIETVDNKSGIIELDKDYKIATYNIGFGAYSDDFSFFMDTGEMIDGKKTAGKHGKAVSKEAVLYNTNGMIKTMFNMDADIYLCQEVDTRSTRSYKVNQVDMLNEFFVEHSSTFAENYHSGYLAYPLLDNIGSSNSGITTLSKFSVVGSVRRQLPLEQSFFGKMTDLDRCFMVSRMETEGEKELVVINLHLSAYQSGELKNSQLQMLRDVLNEEKDKGNYVIVGGDFNMDIADSSETFKTGQKIPDWLSELDDGNIIEGFSFVRADNANEVPTNRNADMPYQKDVSYTSIIDGFIVSDNIKANSQNIDDGFKYSDHNPALMKFKLLI